MEKKFEVDVKTFIGGWYMPEDPCDEGLDLFNDNKSLHQPGIVSAGKSENDAINYEPHIDVEFKKCTQLNVIPDTEELSLYKMHLQLILDTYRQRYEWVDCVNYYKIIESMSVQHYKPGDGFYQWHMENNGHSMCINRHLVFMTYLNDVENGGTEFLYFPDLNIQARKGLTLIWPAGWTHTHRGVVSNVDEKYITTGWFSFYDK